MRNRNQQGFTLIELLIVIAIIGILAAVLIPNLLNARSRAFDTAAQTCLKELSTQEEIIASDEPFGYNGQVPLADLPATSACNDDNMVIAGGAAAAPGTALTFQYWAQDARGSSYYTVSNGTGVTRVAEAAAGATPAAQATALATASGGTAY